MALITLKNINKVYRTDEIETQALENVNIEVQKGEFCEHYGTVGMRKIHIAEYYWVVGCPNWRPDNSQWCRCAGDEG